jgi:hypothetical protein
MPQFMGSVCMSPQPIIPLLELLLELLLDDDEASPPIPPLDEPPPDPPPPELPSTPSEHPEFESAVRATKKGTSTFATRITCLSTTRNLQAITITNHCHQPRC